MLPPLLHALHRIAAQRGDGLRPEFLRMAGEGTPGPTIPNQTEPAALAGDHRAPVAPWDAPSGEEIAACELGLTLRNSCERLRTSLHPRYQPELHPMRCPGPACGVCEGMGDAGCVSQKLRGEHRQ